jgi:integrase
MSRRRNDGEGTIFSQTVTLKDGRTKTYWKAAVRHNGKRHWISAPTRSAASSELKKLLKEIEAGSAAVRSKQTLAQFFEEWLKTSVKPTVRPRTYQAYEERVRLHVLPDLGRLKLQELSARHLQRLYARKLEDGLSSSTLNGIHVVVHRALKQALRWELVGKNVAEGVDVPQPRPTAAKPFSAVELAVFLDGIGSDEREPLWTTFLLTGLRFGELAALRWSDIDLEQRTLTVRYTITRDGSKGYVFSEPKTTKSRRVIPLPSAAIAALRRQQALNDDTFQLASVWEVSDLVFPSGRGTPLREPKILVAFHELLERLGLPRRRLHDLRHTFATRLFALDVHPRAAQELLGHANIATTMNRYTSSVPSVLRDAVDRLDGEHQPRLRVVRGA